MEQIVSTKNFQKINPFVRQIPCQRFPVYAILYLSKNFTAAASEKIDYRRDTRAFVLKKEVRDD